MTCRFCTHRVASHNQIEGCSVCECMATAKEAEPRTAHVELQAGARFTTRSMTGRLHTFELTAGGIPFEVEPRPVVAGCSDCRDGTCTR